MASEDDIVQRIRIEAEGGDEVAQAYKDVGAAADEAAQKIQQAGEGAGTGFEQAGEAAAQAAAGLGKVGDAAQDAGGKLSEIDGSQFAALTASIESLGETAQQAFASLGDTLESIGSSLGGTEAADSVAAISDAGTEAAAGLESAADAGDRVIDTLTAIGEAATQAAQGLTEVGAGGAGVAEALERISAAARESGEGLGQAGEQAVGFWEKFKAFAEIADAVGKVAEFGQTAIGIFGKLSESGVTFSSVLTRVNTAASTVWSSLSRLRELDFSRIGTSLLGIVDSLGRFASVGLERIGPLFEGISSSAGKLVDNVSRVGGLTPVFANLAQAASSAGASIGRFAEGATVSDRIVNAVSKSTTALVLGFQNIVQWAAAAAGRLAGLAVASGAVAAGMAIAEVAVAALVTGLRALAAAALAVMVAIGPIGWALIAIAAAVTAAVVVFDQLKGSIEGLAKANAEMQKLALTTGETFNSLQRGQALFGQLGISATSFANAIKKIAEGMASINVGRELQRSAADAEDAIDRVLQAEKALLEEQIRRQDAGQGRAPENAYKRLLQIQNDLADSTASLTRLQIAYDEAVEKVAEQAANNFRDVLATINQLKEGATGLEFSELTKTDLLVKAVNASLKQTVVEGGNVSAAFLKILGGVDRLTALRLGKAFGISEEEVERFQRLGVATGELARKAEELDKTSPNIGKALSKSLEELQKETDKTALAWERLRQAWEKPTALTTLVTDVIKLFERLKNTVIDFVASAMEQFNKFVDDVPKFFSTLPERLEATYARLREQWSNLLADLAQKGAEFADAHWFTRTANNLRQLSDIFRTNAQNWAAEAEAASARLQSAWDEAGESAKKSAEEMKKAADGVGTSIDRLNNKVTSLRPLTGDQLRQMWQDGIIAMEEYRRRFEALNGITPPSYEILRRAWQDRVYDLTQYRQKLEELFRINPPTYDQLRQMWKDRIIDTEEYKRRLNELGTIKITPADAERLGITWSELVRKVQEFKDQVKAGTLTQQQFIDKMNELLGKKAKVEDPTTEAKKGLDELKAKIVELQRQLEAAKRLPKPEIDWKPLIAEAERAVRGLKDVLSKIKIEDLVTPDWKKFFAGAPAAFAQALSEIDLSGVKPPDFTKMFEGVGPALKQAIQNIDLSDVQIQPPSMDALLTAAEQVAERVKEILSGIDLSGIQLMLTWDSLITSTEQIAKQVEQIFTEIKLVVPPPDFSEAIEAAKRAGEEIRDALKVEPQKRDRADLELKPPDTEEYRQFKTVIGEILDLIKQSNEAYDDFSSDDSTANVRAFEDSIARIAAKYPDVKRLFESFKEVNEAKDAMKIVDDSIKQTLERATNALRTLFRPASDSAKEAATDIQKAFSDIDLSKAIDWSDIGEGAEDAVEAVEDAFADIDITGSDFAGALDFETITQAAEDAAEGIEDAFADIDISRSDFAEAIDFDEIVEAAEDAAEDIENAFADIDISRSDFAETLNFESIVENAEDAARDIEDAFRDIDISGDFSNALNFDVVVQAATNAAQEIQQAFANIELRPNLEVDFSEVIFAAQDAAQQIQQTFDNIDLSSLSTLTADFSGLVTSAQTAATQISTAFQQIGVADFQPLLTAAQTAFDQISQQALTLAQGISSAFQAIDFSGLVAQIYNVVSAFQAMEQAAYAAAAAAREAAAAAAEARAAGAGMARGGLFRGRPGIDTNLAWLTDMEFVMRPEAVMKYGVRFMDLINSLSFPMNGFREGGLNRVVHTINTFRDGGLFNPRAIVIPSFRTGGINESGGGKETTKSMRPLNLTIGAEKFDGLLAPMDTAKAMERVAVGKQLSATGLRPRWNK
jgi:hypothetical protein